MVKQNEIKIGEVYCVYIADLRYCRVEPHRENYDPITDRIHLTTVKNDIITQKQRDIPVFIRYLGNNLFEEMETGQKLALAEGTKSDEYTYDTLVGYPEAIQYLDKVARYPIIVVSEVLLELAQGEIHRYSDNDGDKLVPTMLNQFHTYAKDKFHESLASIRKIAYQNYNRDKTYAKVMEFKSRPLPKIEESI